MTQQQSARKVDPQDHRKRMAVFTMPRKAVLVKIYGEDEPLTGFEVKTRDEKRIHTDHKAEAERKGLKFNAYRSKGDTGFPIIEKEWGRIADSFIEQLKADGLVFTGCHCFPQIGGPRPQDKSYTHVMEFNRPGNLRDDGTPYVEQEIPRSALPLLSEESWEISVWANQRIPEGKPAFRLDTVNLREGDHSVPSDPALHIEGSTYRLV